MTQDTAFMRLALQQAHEARKAKMKERMQEKREQLKEEAAKNAAPAEEAPKAE